MKKINPNDEVNAKILQILDERENDIAAANKALEELYNEQQDESWDVEIITPIKIENYEQEEKEPGQL